MRVQRTCSPAWHHSEPLTRGPLGGLRVGRWFRGAVLVSAVILPSLSLAEQPQPNWLQYWRDATVAIGKIEQAKVGLPNGKQVEKKVFVVLGTGVLFGLPGATTGVPWLVTARHLFADPDQKWDPETVQIRFSWFEQQPVDEYVGITLKLKANGKPLWMSHSGRDVDLAAIPVLIDASQVGRKTVGSVPIENFATADDLFEGAAVLVFGYPALQVRRSGRGHCSALE